MPTLEVASDDLVLIVPCDLGDDLTRVRVLVGDRPVGLLQSLSVTVSVTKPAEVHLSFPPMGEWWPQEIRTRLLAAQSLVAPFLLTVGQTEPRRGPTLWDRLEDE